MVVFLLGIIKFSGFVGLEDVEFIYSVSAVETSGATHAPTTTCIVNKNSWKPLDLNNPQNWLKTASLFE